MSNAISGEFHFFIYAILTGGILSAVYDILRIFRRIYAHGFLLIAIEDFVYWLGSALYISYILLFENNGIIRWFFVLGLFIGMLIYNLTISHFLVTFFSKIISKLLHIIKDVIFFLSKPMRCLWKISKKIQKKLKKPLKNSLKTIKIGVSKK